MKTHGMNSPARLADDALLARVHELAQCERRTTVELIAHLAEMDRRRLHLAEGCSSLFTYCTEVLHFSEHAAYNRIECARAARRFPLVLERLVAGTVHLTAVRLLSPHLTPANHAELLRCARHLGKRGVEAIIAALRPLPDVPTSVRRLPSRPTMAVDAQSRGTAALDDQGQGTTALDAQGKDAAATPLELSGNEVQMTTLPDTTSAAPCRPAILVPLAPERYRVQFTADEEMHGDLLAATELLRHQVPNGDPVSVMKLALKLLVRELRRRKFGATTRPCPPSGITPDHNSRHIPAGVRREVVRRDGNRCAFRSRSGRRCSALGQLEFHHLEPYAVGGQATIANISLRCRAHNAHEAGGWLVREPAISYGNSLENIRHFCPTGTTAQSVDGSFRNESALPRHHGPP